MRTVQELKKMLVGSDPNVIDSTEQDAIFTAFTWEEKQEVLRECQVEYQPAIDTSKAGDMANEAGSFNRLGGSDGS